MYIHVHVHRLDIAFLREYCLLLQGRRDLKTIVYCYGGGNCNIELNTATTAGDVSLYHPSIHPSIYLSIHPFIHSPILLIKSSIHLSIIHCAIYLPIHLHIGISIIHHAIYLSIHIHIGISIIHHAIYLPIHLHIGISIIHHALHLSIHLPIGISNLSIHLSIYN